MIILVIVLITLGLSLLGANLIKETLNNNIEY